MRKSLVRSISRLLKYAKVCEHDIYVDYSYARNYANFSIYGVVRVVA